MKIIKLGELKEKKFEDWIIGYMVEAKEFLKEKETEFACNRGFEKKGLIKTIKELEKLYVKCYVGIDKPYNEGDISDNLQYSDTLILIIPAKSALDVIAYIGELSPDEVERIDKNTFSLWWD